jgi:hypothetical protein
MRMATLVGKTSSITCAARATFLRAQACATDLSGYVVGPGRKQPADPFRD